MPATRLTKKYSNPWPEMDVLKAFIRERMSTKGHKLNYDQLAEKVGISSSHLRLLMSDKPTAEWKPEQRKAVCKALGLDEDTVTMTAIFYRKERKP